MCESVVGYSTGAYTKYDGISYDLKPSFFRLDGTSGIVAPITAIETNSTIKPDYFAKLWIRSTKQTDQIGKSEG